MQIYAVIPQEGNATGVVAEGTFLINYFPVRVLFDLGATHSFIDFKLMYKLSLKLSMIVHPMSVSILLGHSTNLD